MAKMTENLKKIFENENLKEDSFTKEMYKKMKK